MSLKAKIEAVIYAAEEPVTLAQLVGLLGQEGQIELDRLASAQQTLALESGIPLPAEPELLNEEVFDAEHFLDDEDEESEDGEDSKDANQAVQPIAATAPPLSDGASMLPPEPASAAGPGPDLSTAAVEDALEIAAEQGSEPAASVTSLKDERQLAREAKERERNLREFFRSLLDELVRDYNTSDRGLEIREVAGGFRLATKPEYHDAVRGFVKSLKPPLKLSLQALETLAVVSYKQPITAPEVSEIRGVDSGGVLGSLMARKLITTAGRKQVIGRPILYKTTKDFLLRFGLKDISELPSIEEFEKMAGELAEPQDEIPMPQHASPDGPSAESAHADPELSRRTGESVESITGVNLEEERDATEPQADGDGATVDSISPDARNAGVDPDGSSADADPSAAEAQIQRNEQNDTYE